MNNATPPRLERDILQDAATALCREYGDATRRWGYAPQHLRRAVEARGLLS